MAEFHLSLQGDGNVHTGSIHWNIRVMINVTSFGIPVSTSSNVSLSLSQTHSELSPHRLSTAVTMPPDIRPGREHRLHVRACSSTLISNTFASAARSCFLGLLSCYHVICSTHNVELAAKDPDSWNVAEIQTKTKGTVNVFSLFRSVCLKTTSQIIRCSIGQQELIRIILREYHVDTHRFLSFLSVQDGSCIRGSFVFWRV